MVHDAPEDDEHPNPWQTLGAREVYRNPWMTVSEHAVVRPDGTQGIYGIVDPGDNAAIVALDDEDCVWLAGEFAYTVQRFEWKIPSGKVEAGEAQAEAARRELAEETGIMAREWAPLGMYYLSVGISTQASYIFLARGLDVGEARPENTEQITLRRMPLAEAVEACLRGEIRDAPSVLGLWRVWLDRRAAGQDNTSAVRG